MFSDTWTKDYRNSIFEVQHDPYFYARTPSLSLRRSDTLAGLKRHVPYSAYEQPSINMPTRSEINSGGGTYNPPIRYDQSYTNQNPSSTVSQASSQQPAPYSVYESSHDINRGSQGFQDAADFPSPRHTGYIMPASSSDWYPPIHQPYQPGSYLENEIRPTGMLDGINEAYNGLNSAIPRIGLLPSTDLALTDRRLDEEIPNWADCLRPVENLRQTVAYPQPLESSQRTDTRGGKPAKPTRRSSRKKVSNKAQSAQREELRLGLESKLDDDAIIPGCHVLTPVATDGTPRVQSNKRAKEKIKRKPMGELERAEVKMKRLYGVCFRCKMYKEKVNL